MSMFFEKNHLYICSSRNNSIDFALTKHKIVTELDNQIVNNIDKSF